MNGFIGERLNALLMAQDLSSQLSSLRVRAATGEPASLLALARFIAEIELSDTPDSWAVEAAKAFENLWLAMKNRSPDSCGENPRFEASCCAWHASFLEGQESFDAAEKMYQRALSLEPNQRLALGNYATFTFKIRRNRAEATRLFENALEANPRHTAIIIKCTSPSFLLLESSSLFLPQTQP